MGAVRKPANLTLDAARWQAENAAALASSNDWVAAHGLPLSRHRPF